MLCPLESFHYRLDKGLIQKLTKQLKESINLESMETAISNINQYSRKFVMNYENIKWQNSTKFTE